MEYKRILIGLDLTLMDRGIIQYAAFLSKILAPDKIIFAHVVRPVENDSSEDEIVSRELQRKKIASLKKEIYEDIEYNFPGLEEYDFDCIVKEGIPIDEILSLSRKKNIDLILLGKKKELRGNGVVNEQLTRSIPCSVWFLPERYKLRLSEVFVCNDFSNFARIALTAAVELVKNNPNATIYSQHVIQAEPNKKVKTAEADFTEDEILDFKENAIKLYNQFLRNIDNQDVHIAPLFNIDTQSAPHIILTEMAHKKRADLIVVGCRNRSLSEPTIIGNITEKLLIENTDIPMLVVKTKIHIDE